MRFHYVHHLKSIVEAPCSDEVADFVVLSGPNGSGKTNLIDAIANGAVRVDDVEQQHGGIRTFRLSDLTLINQPAVQSVQFAEPWVHLQSQIADLQISAARDPGLRESEPRDEYIRSNLVLRKIMKRDVIERLERNSGKSINEVTIADLREHSPLLSGIKDPFTMSIGELFVSYHNRLIHNRFQHFLVREHGEDAGSPIPEDVFTARYGEPPWIELNNTLRIMGLHYTFDKPEGTEQTLSYFVRMRSIEDPTVVTEPEDLSSGEKTLLTLTMCLFTGSHLTDAIELPQVLLLDEADASLHPAMIRSMLQVVKDIFVDKYGVKVILTTHSPTTVALAPEESLYTMRRSPSPRLARAESRDAALRTLTVGLPTLSVKVEDRIQVLVEADQDAGCYQKLYSLPLIRERLGSPFSLQFIASAKKAQGNVDIVLHSVPLLRANGADRIFGLIDCDGRIDRLDHIVFLPNRDNLESLVVDPVALSLYLLREKAPPVLGSGLACVHKPHFSLDAGEVQQLTDFVMSQIVPAGNPLGTTTMTYLGGATVTYPTWALVTDGHDYVTRCRDVFPSLKARQEAPMLLDIIDKVYDELPAWVPTDVQWIFQELLARAAAAD